MQRIKFYVILGFAVVIHLFVTFVVVLFVLSTLNILNRNIFHLANIAVVEKIVISVIFIISAAVFFRSIGKISRTIRRSFPGADHG